MAPLAKESRRTQRCVDQPGRKWPTVVRSKDCEVLNTGAGVASLPNYLEIGRTFRRWKSSHCTHRWRRIDGVRPYRRGNGGIHIENNRSLVTHGCAAAERTFR